MTKSCANCTYQSAGVCECPDKEEWGKEKPIPDGAECQYWKSRRVCAECIFSDIPAGESWKDARTSGKPIKCAYHLGRITGNRPACSMALWRK